MKPRKLKKREFSRAIRHGHGSAFLHVKKYGDSSVEKVLLHACLHNLVYDQMVESDRACWLARIIDATGRIEYYAGAIAKALRSRTVGNRADFEQLVALASEFFDRGFFEFKTILLERLLMGEDCISSPLAYAKGLVDVASVKGFERASRLMSSLGASAVEKLLLCEYACKLFIDQEDLDAHLADLAKTDVLIAGFLKDVEEARALEKQERCAPVSKSATLAELLVELENGAGARSLISKFRRFGKKASEDDLRQVLMRLDLETDTLRLQAYLAAFWFTPPPAVSKKLLGLLFSEDSDLRFAAQRALKSLKSSNLRRAAIKALKSERQEFVLSGLKILALNSRPTDFELINKALDKLKDADHLHWGIMAIRDIALRNSDLKLAKTLCRSFELIPCSFCRESLLETLLEKQAIPAHLLYEAQWDASTDIANIARSQISSAGSS